MQCNSSFCRERSDRELDQSDTEESENSENDDDLFVNTNRTTMHTHVEESSSSSDEQN